MALLYSGLIGTFSGMMLVAYNVKRFGATTSSQTAYIIPVVTSLGGALFLDEQLTLQVIISMVIILLGVWLINSRQAQAAEPAPGD